MTNLVSTSYLAASLGSTIVGISNVAVIGIGVGANLQIASFYGGQYNLTGTPSNWASYPARTDLDMNGHTIWMNQTSYPGGDIVMNSGSVTGANTVSGYYFYPNQILMSGTDFMSGVDYYGNGLLNLYYGGLYSYNYTTVAMNSAKFSAVAFSVSTINQYIIGDLQQLNLAPDPGVNSFSISYCNTQDGGYTVTSNTAPLYISSLYLGGAGVGAPYGQLTTDATATNLYWQNSAALHKSVVGMNGIVDVSPPDTLTYTACNNYIPIDGMTLDSIMILTPTTDLTEGGQTSISFRAEPNSGFFGVYLYAPTALAVISNTHHFMYSVVTL